MTTPSTGHVASLAAVHSPDDGGWYCEFWLHNDDRQRSPVSSEPLDGIHQSARLALAEGREHAKRLGLAVFGEIVGE